MKESKQKTIELAYLIFRLSMGVNMFIHGIVRIPKLDNFNTYILGQFNETILPEFMVSIFAYSLPFIELLVGVLLILGLFTSRALLLGALVIVVLIFGTGLQEKWALISSQMVYAIFFFILTYFIELNRYSIDYYRKFSFKLQKLNFFAR